MNLHHQQELSLQPPLKNKSKLKYMSKLMSKLKKMFKIKLKSKMMNNQMSKIKLLKKVVKLNILLVKTKVLMMKGLRDQSNEDQKSLTLEFVEWFKEITMSTTS